VARSRLRKWLMLAVKLLVVALVVWFVRGTLVKAWHQIGEVPWQPRPAWLAASGGLYLLGLLAAGWFWHHVLRVLGQEARLGETLRAYYIGHLGKYVPGKATVVVVRAGLIGGQRVQTGVAAAAVFLETLTMMAVGAFLAAAIIAARLRGEGLLFWGAIGLMLASGVPTLPPVFKRLARLAGVGRSDPATLARLDRLGYGTLLVGWVAMMFAWAMLAMSLWATFRGVGIDGFGPLEHLSGFLACVSLAMVAGFLSLIPGGLGVRDVILVKLITRLFGVEAGLALVASGLLRLVWLVAELVISAILLVISAILYFWSGWQAGSAPARGLKEH
jgi:uncharacterized membrane protein YbhN (UPF0104 family)